ncbi:MAG: hypothetical protein KDC01_03605, partial [Flavobacteriales bacterium]|nr:hypothetical protein [Flavobacteriales bacterium]
YFDAQVVRQSRAILTELGRKNGTAYDIEKDGLRIHTTLDTALQHAALRSVSKQLSAMQPKLDRELRAGNVRKGWEKKMGKQASADWRQNERSVKEVFRWAGKRLDTLSYRDSLWHYHSMLQAAFLMVDPATGKVRAYSGGNDFRTLPFDQVQSHRPIASAIKPIIYAAGLERGLEPCTYLNNERKTYDELEGWSPQNFDQDTIGGQVALWYALAHSMNIPTVDLYFRTGVDTIRDTFKALGLPVDGVDNPALALGAADVSLQEIVRAYSVFANEGLTRDLQMIERITDARGKVIYQGRMAPATRALDQEVAETVTAMLRRAVDEGTGASMRSRFGVRAALAGKTGTSQDYGDAWFLCYTPGLVAGAWVGARDPEVHFNSALGTGARLALPIIGRTLAAAERSPTMRKQYLRSFPEEITEVDMGCAPRREGNLIERFLDVIFRKDTRTEQDTVKKEKERKGFFRRWFPKKGG